MSTEHTPTHPAGEPGVIARAEDLVSLVLYDCNATIMPQAMGYVKVSRKLGLKMQACLRDLLTAYDQCAREREEAVADAMGVINVLGFFASCIKSGEPWTPECDAMLKQAFAHRAMPTGRGE